MVAQLAGAPGTALLWANLQALIAEAVAVGLPGPVVVQGCHGQSLLRWERASRAVHLGLVGEDAAQARFSTQRQGEWQPIADWTVDGSEDNLRRCVRLLLGWLADPDPAFA